MKHLTLTAAAAAGIALAGDAMAQQQPIRIVGSSTVFPFSTTVAEHFGRSSQYPAPVVESTGTGGGFQLFCEGVGPSTPSISNASRQIKGSEVELCRTHGVDAITEVKIGYDGIVLANSKQADRLSVTIAQLWQAVAKEVPQGGQIVSNPHKSWSDINSSLPNKPISIYGPPPTSGTRDAFVELVMDMGCMQFDGVQRLDENRRKAVCQTVREDGNYVNAGENDNLIVQRLEADPNAFGIFGYSFLDQNIDDLQGSMVNGEEPTFDNIAEGDYPISRSLFFYVKGQHAAVVPGLREYVDAFTSDQAIGPNGYLADKGLIPLTEDERKQVRETANQLKPLTAAQNQG